MTTVQLINRTKIVRVRETRFAALVPALIESNKHLADDWGPDVLADFVYVSKSELESAPDRKIYLLDTSDQAGDLGYHEDGTGVPESKIFVLDDLRYHAQISVTVDHEAKEMQVNPFVNRTAVIDGVIYAMESCDPTEADDFGYPVQTRHGTFQMSDHVLPWYFGFANGGSGPGKFDYMGHLTAGVPALLAGGYQLWTKDGSGWNTTTARFADGSVSYRSMKPFGRQHRIAGG